MKLQSLAIIFIIIIMPITIVLSEYVNNRITTAKTELSYDTKLLNATYDAIKAYQLNTVNNAFGDVTNQKVEDIEAAAKTFYNSLASNFNYSGYRADVMKDYVPAIAFTMYDGYYIYSPFRNTLTEVEEGTYDTDYSDDGDIMEGLKPYVYYTCLYRRSNGDEFVITYTLDNYITIQGTIDGQYVYDYGYLYSIATTENGKGIYHNTIRDSYTYDGIEFTQNDTEELKEFVGTKEYSYVKINGTKYYLNEEFDTSKTGEIPLDEDTSIPASSGIFFIDSDGTPNYSQTRYVGNGGEEDQEFIKYCLAIKKNKSAYEYYKNAYQFSKAVLGTAENGYRDKADTPVSGYHLSDLKASEAYIWNNPASESTSIQEYGDISIFATDANTNLENRSSNFNQHRQTIIRYVVETNLSASIASFSSNAGADFVMPRISEEDWEIIENDVCAISFLQGMSLGSQKYNGYAVVANTLTKEYIDENDIYILTKDIANNLRTYCKPNDSTITSSTILPKSELNYYAGVWKLNFEQKQDVSTGTTYYYIPLSYFREGTQIGYLGSYTSVMGSSKVVSIATMDMYQYMSMSGTDATLKKAYYVGLGRERWGSYNVNNINYELYGNNGNQYFLQSY